MQPSSLLTPANRKPPGLTTGGLLGVTEVAGSVYLQIIPCPQGTGALGGMKKPPTDCSRQGAQRAYEPMAQYPRSGLPSTRAGMKKPRGVPGRGGSGASLTGCDPPFQL
jgi:hypothetical protein